MIEEDNLEGTMRSVSSVTANIQADITSAMLKSPEFAKEFRKQVRMPESDAMVLINEAVTILVGLMPLACHAQVNIVMQVLGTHSHFTGDPAMNEVLQTLNGEEIDKL